MGINTVPQPPYSPDLAPCDFWLFPKFRGSRYETIEEEMKEAVMMVIDTLTLEDFDGAFQKLLELYNKCIAAGGDYFEGDWSFMSVLSIKVPIRKKSGNLFNDSRCLNWTKGFSAKECCQCNWPIRRWTSRNQGPFGRKFANDHGCSVLHEYQMDQLKGQRTKPTPD